VIRLTALVPKSFAAGTFRRSMNFFIIPQTPEEVVHMNFKLSSDALLNKEKLRNSNRMPKSATNKHKP